MKALLALALLAVPLTGCNRNSAEGNDREAQLDPAPTPAPVTGADAALENVATGVIKPATMSDADLAAIGGLRGKCAVRLTEVGDPSFAYAQGSRGFIKLNSKLVELPAAGEGRFAQGGLSVTLRPNGESGDAGLPGVDMLLVPPGAKDELGYSGFLDCAEDTGQ